MGDGDKVDRPRRGRLRRDLTRETRRLMQHVDHLSVDEVRTLEAFVTDLEGIHVDNDECRRLAQRHGDKPPPWGTKYANAVERAIFTVFPRRR
jgi:chloramphenicol 3-O-phosphotransferase